MLLEDMRKEVAGRHLSESKLAICEIAFLLGYSKRALSVAHSSAGTA
jgi:hypothetical protein